VKKRVIYVVHADGGDGSDHHYLTTSKKKAELMEEYIDKTYPCANGVQEIEVSIDSKGNIAVGDRMNFEGRLEEDACGEEGTEETKLAQEILNKWKKIK